MLRFLVLRSADGNDWTDVTPPLSRPRLVTATSNDPKDPLMIGVCAILRCQQQFDFIDVVLDRRGREWTSMVDGCPSPGRSSTWATASWAG